MKKVFTIRIVQVLLLVILFFACDKSLVEKNGLTKEINDVIPEEILDILDSLEMPIYRGDNPPIVNGTYLSSPHVLFSSNRTNDVIGKTYSDLNIAFSNENLDELEIVTSYTQASSHFEGLGSFIVGDEGKFSVFVISKSYRKEYGDSSLIARIFSGELAEDGISNFYATLVMVDDYGDPNDYYIAIGDARVLKDEDGMAENYSDDKSIILIEDKQANGIFKDEAAK